MAKQKYYDGVLWKLVLYLVLTDSLHHTFSTESLIFTFYIPCARRDYIYLSTSVLLSLFTSPLLLLPCSYCSLQPIYVVAAFFLTSVSTLANQHITKVTDLGYFTTSITSPSTPLNVYAVILLLFLFYSYTELHGTI